MSIIIDISIPMTSSVASWPGDTPFSFRLNWEKAKGSSVNVGSITTSLHSGTHADAPFHFYQEGKTIDQVNLSPFIGPAIVIEVRDKAIITVEELLPFNFSDSPRVLFKTSCWEDHTSFPDSIPVLHDDVPAFLEQRGVVLVGFDVPSVDHLDSKDLAIHHKLHASGISILESLRLSDVAPGMYELIALPLNIVGGDGAPVRAILRK